MCKWRATYCWKALNKGYNFALDFISIGGPHAQLWAPKVAGILVVTKCHLDVGFMGSHKIYYKGEGDDIIRENVMASPKSRPW